MSDNISEDDRRFLELNRKLDEKLFMGSVGFGQLAEQQLRAAKKEALQQMEKAINEGNFFAATGYQAQYRYCKLALREY
jgi:hypothetical protein